VAAVLIRETEAEAGAGGGDDAAARLSRRVIETSHEGIWVTDREGRTTLTNRRLAAMLGRDDSEMAGVRLADDHVHVHRLAAPAVHALEHALVRKRSVVQRLVQRDDARPSAQDACGELGKLSEHAALEDGGGHVHHIGAGEVMNEEVAAMHRRWWQRGREAACGCRESSESLLCCSV
jgi:PAS domain-containing protein